MESAKLRFLSFVTEFAGARAAPLLVRASTAEGPIDLAGSHLDNSVADLTLRGNEIEFSCYLGIHGSLYPEFKLDPDSSTQTATGEPYTQERVLRVLRTCFRSSSELTIRDDLFEADEETFVVDPATEQELHEAHTT